MGHIQPDIHEIFNEALDFTCGIASPTGEMLAVAEFCPAQIGGMPLLIRSCLEEIPLTDIEPGDVIVHNDPYRGGLHTPEHTLFCPVYVDDELVAFTVAIGHVAEVGVTVHHISSLWLSAKNMAFLPFIPLYLKVKK